MQYTTETHRWRGINVFFHCFDNIIVQNYRVQGPTLMRTRDLLSHCCEEALRVEETSHPEHTRPAIENPSGELAVPLQKLCKPETQGR